MLLVIVGPTAVGKTQLSLDLASILACEIVSADSMQVYRGMDIGTAKPSNYEKKVVPHHLLDVVEPDQRFTVAEYVELAGSAIVDIRVRDRLPLVTGGTGLYINALTDGFLFPDQGRNPKLRDKLSREYADNPKKLHGRLQAVDAQAAAKLHPNDTRRIIRALEVYYTTGQPISVLQQKMSETEGKYTVVKVGLTRGRDTLYRRVEKRVDGMLEQGLIREVGDLLQKYPSQPTALQAIGYKEIALFLQDVITLDEAVYLIKRDTRRYAKRQLSWFRRDSRIHWYNLDEVSQAEVVDSVIEQVNQQLKNH